MAHDSLEAGALEALPGGVRGFLIGVGANLNAVIFVALRGNNEGGKFFLLQVRGEAHGVRFAAQGGDLQGVGIGGNRGGGGLVWGLYSWFGRERGRGGDGPSLL